MPKFKPGDKVRFINPSSLNAHYFRKQLRGLTIKQIDTCDTTYGQWYLVGSPIITTYYVTEAELTLEYTHIHTKANTCLKLNAITT